MTSVTPESASRGTRKHRRPQPNGSTTATGQTTSRCSKDSKRSASAPACTSARPARAVCTTWSRRSSTTRSTRRWPGTATRIVVTILPDGGVRCVDNGRGIPVDIHKAEGKSTVEVVLTVLHAGGKFGGGGYAVSGGLHGVGSSVVNALSSRLEVEVKRQGYVWRQSYRDGGMPELAARAGRGERRDRHDDHVLAGRRHLRDRRLRVRDAAHPLPADGVPQQGSAHRPARRASRARRTSEEAEPGQVVLQQRHDSFLYERGLVDYVEYLNRVRKAEHVNDEVIDFESEDTERKISLEVAMQWTTSYTENVFTYANTINTHEGGTHEEGFRAALTTLVNKYARAQEPAQGEGREPLGRRRPRGTHRRHLDQALRAAVRGPDQDQARQHRGEGVRAEGGRRSARRLVRPQPGAGEERRPQGDRRRDRAPGRAQGARDRAPQERVRVARRCPTSSRTARRRTRRSARSSSSRATRPAARPCRVATRTPRRSWRCAARSSTSSARASTAPSATARCRR